MFQLFHLQKELAELREVSWRVDCCALEARGGGSHSSVTVQGSMGTAVLHRAFQSMLPVSEMGRSRHFIRQRIAGGSHEEKEYFLLGKERIKAVIGTAGTDLLVSFDKSAC